MVLGKAAPVSIQAAVVGEIIAADHANRRCAGGVAQPQSGDQPADGAFWNLRAADVVDDVRMGEVQLAGAGQTIALLGHGQGDHRHLGRGQGRKHLVRRLGRSQHLFQRPDHPKAHLPVQFDQGVKPVLRGQGVAHPGALQRDRADAPARVGGQQPVEHVGLVGAVKRAWPQMHNADRHRSSVIGRNLDPFGDQAEMLVRQTWCVAHGYGLQ